MANYFNPGCSFADVSPKARLLLVVGGGLRKPFAR